MNRSDGKVNALQLCIFSSFLFSILFCLPVMAQNNNINKIKNEIISINNKVEQNKNIILSLSEKVVNEQSIKNKIKK